MPVIKRYPNRKLYDTEAKRYVTLDHIAALIQANEDVLVIDHETGEDLTNLTLSQIIFEQEKKGSGILSRSLLTNLIRTGGDTLDQVRRALIAPLHLDSSEHRGSEHRGSEHRGSEHRGSEHRGSEHRGSEPAGSDKAHPAAGIAPEGSLIYRVDELFQDVLTTLNVPTSRDLRQLQAQLDELNSKISALLEAQQTDETASEPIAETDAAPKQP